MGRVGRGPMTLKCQRQRWRGGHGAWGVTRCGRAPMPHVGGGFVASLRSSCAHHGGESVATGACDLTAALVPSFPCKR